MINEVKRTHTKSKEENHINRKPQFDEKPTARIELKVQQHTRKSSGNNIKEAKHDQITPSPRVPDEAKLWSATLEPLTI